MIEEDGLESPDFVYKVILIGNARVGKTSITKQFVKGQFDEDQQSSVVCSVYNKRIAIEEADEIVAEL